MGKTFEDIDDRISGFIQRQHMFFVATAPSDPRGHVNLSPKGLDSFRILDRQTVLYADLIGSGIETVAHLNENARIVLMFCAFEGAPKIIRLHGQGEVIRQGHRDFDDLASRFETFAGLRCLIRVHCDRISDSCGFGVPLYEFRGQRNQLTEWGNRKSLASLDDYIAEKNTRSIDGLPGLQGRSETGE